MAQTINIQRLWDQRYRDESVPFPVDGTPAGQAPVFNVKDSAYGAVGDGVTTDTSAIQAAITAASPGGTVLFPPGAYKAPGLTVPSTALVTLQGSGPSGYSTLLAPGVSRIVVPVGSTGLTVGAATGGSFYTGSPVMRDLHFQGPGASANSSTVGLDIKNVSGFRVSDCTFSDFYTAGTGAKVESLNGFESAYGHFTGCRFLKNFIGLDCGIGPSANVAAIACLFDAENNSLPTPAAGSIAIKNPARVIGCELQSYETLINVDGLYSEIAFIGNRYENYLNAVYFRPASDNVYRGQVVGGTMSSAVGGALGVRFNSHASQVTVDLRAWSPHEDLNGANSILDPNISLTHRTTGFDRGLHIGYSAASDIGWFSYPGNPEGAVTATPGSILGDTVNGELWVKHSGTGNTGWKLVTRAA